jgi:type II secretory pathway pseudopilin PulG
MSNLISKIKPTLISDTKSFTLVELLIIVGLIAVLSVAIILAINPAELIKQTRDSQRLSNLTNLSKAISLYEADTNGQGFMGTSSVVYVSIPDTTSTCANLGLPQLPPSWSYRCVSSSTLQNIDGTGWIPINFNNLSFGKTLPKLPIDPINTTSSGNYYTYVSGGSFELTSLLESSKYQNLAINDGDAFPGVYSTRTSANPLTPGLRDKGLVGYWSFDEASGTIAYDRSGYNNNGTLINGPVWTTGKVGSALSFDGVNDYVRVLNSSSLQIIKDITILALIKPISLGSRQVIVDKKYNQEFRFGYINENSPYGIVAMHGNGSSYSVLNIINSTDLNQWQYIALKRIFSSNNYYFGYKNGLLNLNPSFSLLPAISNNDVFIGSREGSSEWFNGLIDEVRIYNRALSDEEIKAIYEATK